MSQYDNKQHPAQHKGNKDGHHPQSGGQNRGPGGGGRMMQQPHPSMRVVRGGPGMQRGVRWGFEAYRPRTFPGEAKPNPKNKNPLKFDNDYDFEQANTEFEELM